MDNGWDQPWQWGWTCEKCGTWVLNGSTHACGGVGVYSGNVTFPSTIEAKLDRIIQLLERLQPSPLREKFDRITTCRG